jgi:DNA-binding NtrC family response regulator
MKKLALSSSAKEQLMRYNYPGNVRELKAIIDLACVMCDGTEISADDISFPSVKGNEEYMSMEKTLKEYTVDIIAFFLKKYNNNVVEVAQKLDVGKSTIYNLINSGDLKKV